MDPVTSRHRRSGTAATACTRWTWTAARGDLRGGRGAGHRRRAGKVYPPPPTPDTLPPATASRWPGALAAAGEHGVHPVPPDLPVPPADRSFLITEACAARAACLHAARRYPLHAGARHPRRAGAARHRRRAIDFEMKKHGLDHVHLDFAPGRTFLAREHFPNIHALPSLGIDIAREPIPVVPARTTPAAAWSPTWTAAPTVGPAARGRDRPPACTAPTGWPATRWWNAPVWQAAAWRILARCRTAAVPAGDDSRVDRRRRAGGHRPQLGRAAPADVELRRHRAHDAAARAGAAPHQAAQSEIDDYYANFRVNRDLLELRNRSVAPS